MSEKFNITYRGQLVEALETDSGEIIVGLPEQDGYRTTVVSCDQGWRFIRTDNSDIEYHFWMQLDHNNNLEHGNDVDRNQPGMKVSEYGYNPDTSYMGHLDDVAREFYCVVEQLRGYKKLGVSPIDLINLRKGILDRTLKFLGYDSPQDVLYGEPNPGKSIMDLEKAIVYLEKHPALSQYATKANYRGVESVKTKIPDPFKFNKEEFRNVVKAATTFLDIGNRNYDERMEYLSDKRNEWFLPDFCMDMKHGVDPDDWQHYVDITRAMAKLVLGFNADLLSPDQKMKIVQATGLEQLDLLDKVAMITDSDDVGRAIDIETYYFVDEAERYDRKVRPDAESSSVKGSNPSNVALRHIAENNAEAAKKLEKIKSRSYYRHDYLYRKLEEKEPEKISVEEYLAREEAKKGEERE